MWVALDVPKDLFGDWVIKFFGFLPDERCAPGVGEKATGFVSTGLHKVGIALFLGADVGDAFVGQRINMGEGGSKVAELLPWPVNVAVKLQLRHLRTLIFVLFFKRAAESFVVAFDWFEGSVGNTAREKRGSSAEQAVARYDAVVEE